MRATHKWLLRKSQQYLHFKRASSGGRVNGVQEISIQGAGRQGKRRMTEIAIPAEGLSKRYRIGERERYSALRDVLARTLRAPWKVFQRTPNETFWALKGVDLEVRHGEVLGLIGRNGAGKTTLLKILSRITWPTSGWAEIHGRIGSLLEVGTGFHPELTGRENTFLSGAILGMGKSEIKRKFDEIVAFAELEQFIDTPVNTIPAECTSVSPSPSPPISSRKSSLSTKSWPSGISIFRKSASVK